MKRERHLSLFLGTELVTMFTNKVVQISQAKTYFFTCSCYHELWSHLGWNFLCSKYLCQVICACTCKEGFSPKKIRVKDLVLTSWPKPKNCTFKAYKLCALLQSCKAYFAYSFHSEHLIRFNWMSLNHIFPLHNVLWTTAERVWSSIYLLYLSYRGRRKNLHMIIRILLDLGSLIICKLWL